MNIYQNLKQDSLLGDGLARFESINPAKSFIVQAPAGSGKTSLLTQRFLALLAVVENPEQIVAMTFTKKAVSEMKLRILEALQFCVETPEEALSKQSLYNQNTWHLAKLALANNANKGWNLLENPHRLRIRSIDSFNAFLVGKMPILSQMGGKSAVSGQVDKLYLMAARETLNTETLSEQIINLMGLVNGNRKFAEAMIADMLRKRDQWMPLLNSIQSGGELEDFNISLEHLVAVVFEELVNELSPHIDILKQAKTILDEAENIEFLEFINPQLEDLTAWQVFIDYLLTKSGDIRKQAGLKAKTKAEKELKIQFKGCLEELQAKNYDGQLAKNLHAILNLPDTRYTDEQWQGIQDLWRLLLTAAAHLKLVFKQQHTTDFIEIAQAASESLGETDEPTDLAEKLDYQIQHLLIDEFQDTSVSQFVLLKKLIAGWSIEDNHTLFVVGDPMQSIYRFREAEVGNFLEAWQGNIGQFPLEQQQLTVNFRSKLGVVDWVNKNFKNVMPKQNKIEKGAVCYSPSTAFSTDLNDAVTTYWRVNQTDEDKVNEFVDALLTTLKMKQPNETIGILGRTRSVLVPVIKQLKKRKIPFRAIEIETLAERQEIQDLESLTRALIHLNDRAAWVALLRTASIGLSLNDLSVLLEAKEVRNVSVWSVLQQHKLEEFAQLSSEGKMRLNRVYDRLDNAIQQIGLVSWSRLIKETWLILDFAQTIESVELLQNIDAFWENITDIEVENNGDLSKFLLTDSLTKLYALPDSSEQARQVEIMTMHKSKGLEFDYVFLPELNKMPMSDNKQLVSWLNFQQDGIDNLVFSPLPQKGKNKASVEDKKLASFIENISKEKHAYELGRLFYVACTRAKKELHLFANVDYTESQLAKDVPITPKKGSLLSVFWNVQKNAFIKLAQEADFIIEEQQEEDKKAQVSRLLLTGLTASDTLDKLSKNNLQGSVNESVENAVIQDKKQLDLRQENKLALMVTSVGTLVHQLFELWGNQKVVPNSIDDSIKKYLSYWLVQQGVESNLIDEALARVLVSLNHAIKNKKFCWALTTAFKESATELSLTSEGLAFTDKDSMENINHIIDLTFVDEQDTRWIVDYKTSFYSKEMGKSKSQFIEEQVEKYRPQLNRYAELFKEIESRKQIKILYFSYLDEWVEV